MGAVRKIPERDQLALELMSRGYSNHAIARKFNVSAPAVTQMIQRAAAANEALSVDLSKPSSLTALYALRKKLWRIINGKHYRATVTGALIPGPDGEFLCDPDPVTRAIGMLIKVEERISKLTGADAPARSSISLEARLENATDGELDAVVVSLERRIALAGGEVSPPPALRAITAAPEPDTSAYPARPDDPPGPA